MDESWQIGSREKKADLDDKRRRPRQSLMMAAEVRMAGGEPREVRVRNLSSGGALVACRSCPMVGDRVRIKLRGVGEVEGQVSRSTQTTVAITFDRPIDPTLAQPAPTREPVQILHHNPDPRRPGLGIK